MVYSKYIYKHIKPYIRKYLDIYLKCDVCDKIKVKNKRRCKHGTLYCENHKIRSFKLHVQNNKYANPGIHSYT